MDDPDQSRTNVYHLNGRLVEYTTREKDLGVIVTSNLKTATQTQVVCSSARCMLGAIRRSFLKLSPAAFTLLFAAHIRSRLEYASSAIYPCTVGEMDMLNRVQR